MTRSLCTSACRCAVRALSSRFFENLRRTGRQGRSGQGLGMEQPGGSPAAKREADVGVSRHRAGVIAAASGSPTLCDPADGSDAGSGNRCGKRRGRIGNQRRRGDQAGGGSTPRPCFPGGAGVTFVDRLNIAAYPFAKMPRLARRLVGAMMTALVLAMGTTCLCGGAMKLSSHAADPCHDGLCSDCGGAHSGENDPMPCPCGSPGHDGSCIHCQGAMLDDAIPPANLSDALFPGWVLPVWQPGSVAPLTELELHRRRPLGDLSPPVDPHTLLSLACAQHLIPAPAQPSPRSAANGDRCALTPASAVPFD